MAFKNTVWEYSGEVDKSSIPVEEGDRYLYIKDASLSDDKIYSITVEDLTSGAEFQLRYWLNSADENGNITPDARARGVLISLGMALAGTPIGIPNPIDIKHGVVVGEIKFKAGTTYPRCYRFKTPDAGIILFAKEELAYPVIDQASTE